MRKQLGLYDEIKESIIENYHIKDIENFNKWLENIMKDLYDYNKKTFLVLNEKETDIFRKVYCEKKKTSSVSKEYGMVTCNTSECLRRKKRELIKKIGIMYNLNTNKETSLENTTLWPSTVDALAKLELKKVSDITNLSKREFLIITSVIPKKMQEEVLNMLELYKIEINGPEIIIEENDVFIDELNLSWITVKSLFWSGIKTKSQIMNLSKQDLKRIIGLGQNEYEIIELFQKENKEINETSDNNIIIEPLDMISIERLNLNTRTIQALRRNNIKTLEDLFQVPAQDLKKMKGLGIKSLYELLEKIRYIGYEFPKEYDKKETIEEIIKRIEPQETETNDKIKKLIKDDK